VIRELLKSVVAVIGAWLVQRELAALEARFVAVRADLYRRQRQGADHGFN
jgi:hypothetical protein